MDQRLMEKETIEAVSHLFTEEFECEICLEHNLVEDKITLSCKHLLCKICYSKIIIKKSPRCPFCNKEIEEKDSNSLSCRKENKMAESYITPELEALCFGVNQNSFDSDYFSSRVITWSDIMTIMRTPKTSKSLTTGLISDLINDVINDRSHAKRIINVKTHS